MTGYEICKEELKKMGWDLKIKTHAEELGVESANITISRPFIEKAITVSYYDFKNKYEKATYHTNGIKIEKGEYHKDTKTIDIVVKCSTWNYFDSKEDVINEINELFEEMHNDYENIEDCIWDILITDGDVDDIIRTL